MNTELVSIIVAQVTTAVGIYAAIRADLREALVRVAATEKRLDKLEAAK